ncbi:MAG: penicillin-binding protein 2 [Candidatus Omnitrophota bacterium]
MRSRSYRIICCLCFAALAAGLFFTQIIRGGKFLNLSLKNSIRLIPEVPLRGRILDRNGQIFADNILSFDVVIIPQEVKDKELVFRWLSGIFSVDEEEVLRRFERGYLNPFTPVVIAEGISKTQAITLEEEALDFAGAHVVVRARRFYPHGTTAAHALGTIGEIDRSRITRLKDYGYDLKDKVGYSGIEETWDMVLRGEKGGQQVEVDNRGRQVRLLGYRPAVMGRDIQLTLDLELQQICEELLADYRGAVVVMDVQTGEILVTSSSPAFNPNVFVDRKDKKTLNYYLTSKDAPLFNRVTSGQFPPGSVFKPVTAIAAMNAKPFSPSLTYVCPGQMKIGNRFFKCWNTHGAQDFYRAMAHSCDVYFYHLGLMAGPDSLWRWAHEFGFASETGVDLSGEKSGLIPSRMWKRLKRFENWYDGDTANFSIGQGAVLVTPLQLVRMMAVIANDGSLVVPHVTKSAGDEALSFKEGRRVKIPDGMLELLRKSLRLAVSLEDGTAHMLDAVGLEICAKTGTAQVYGQESHGWVAGFFPFQKPRYAFCILLENVGSSYHACLFGKNFFEEALKRNKLTS